MYENLVLSGGGIKGICHLGAIQQLVQLGMIDLKKIVAIAGSSIGAIIGMFLVLGYDIEQIKDLIFKLDVSKLFTPDVILFAEELGMDDGSTIMNYLEKVLTITTGISLITFKDLRKHTGIDYTVVGTCIDTKQAVYFNHINTPDIQVSKAIRISYSLPILFTPVTIDGKKYVDGACVDNFPMDLFKDKMSKTIGILLCNDNNTKSDCAEEYLMALFNLMMHVYFSKDKDHKNNTIFVHMKKSVASINFKVTEDAKQSLFQDGIDAVNNFCKKVA